MLHLKDKREVRFLEITEEERTGIERIFKIILEEYDDVIF